MKGASAGRKGDHHEGLLREAEALLLAFRRSRGGRSPSQATMAAYRADVRRMAERRLWPERMAGTANAFHRYRAAALAVAADRLERASKEMAETLAARGLPSGTNVDNVVNVDNPEAEAASAMGIPLGDGFRKAVKAVSDAVALMRRYPPGTRGVVGPRGPVSWSPEMTDASMRGRVGCGTRDSGADERLPDGWREAAWAEAVEAGSRHLAAFACLLSAPVGTAGLARGVSVATDGESLRIMPRGQGFLKAFRPAETEAPWTRFLRETAMSDGKPFGSGKVGVLQVTVPKPKGMRETFMHFAAKGLLRFPDFAWAEALRTGFGRPDALAVKLATGWGWTELKGGCSVSVRKGAASVEAGGVSVGIDVGTPWGNFLKGMAKASGGLAGLSFAEFGNSKGFHEALAKAVGHAVPRTAAKALRSGGGR